MIFPSQNMGLFHEIKQKQDDSSDQSSVRVLDKTLIEFILSFFHQFFLD